MGMELILGVKRSRFRGNDSRAARADAEFAAKRKPALVRQGYKCVACGYKSSDAFAHLDIHHADDDHHNNDDENLLVGCHTCHPYQHVGELVRRTDIPAEGLGKRTLIASIPEISASDLNLLQRAIGAALSEPQEAEFAKQMMNAIADRHMYVKADFGSSAPADFAAGMAVLTNEEYAHRGEAIADLRLLFNVDVLKILGGEFIKDNPSMPVNRWDAVFKTVESRKASPK